MLLSLLLEYLLSVKVGEIFEVMFPSSIVFADDVTVTFLDIMIIARPI